MPPDGASPTARRVPSRRLEVAGEGEQVETQCLRFSWAPPPSKDVSRASVSIKRGIYTQTTEAGPQRICVRGEVLGGLEGQLGGDGRILALAHPASQGALEGAARGLEMAPALIVGSVSFDSHAALRNDALTINPLYR